VTLRDLIKQRLRQGRTRIILGGEARSAADVLRVATRQ